jgi:hypothetical protein
MWEWSSAPRVIVHMRKLSLRTSLALVLLLSIPAFGAPKCQQDYTYEALDRKTCVITGYHGPPGAVVIPQKLNGLKVVEIGAGAFDEFIGLTQVTIPEGVCHIGDAAFSGCEMTNLTIPRSVKSIGDYAFAYCYQLTDVSIEGGLEEIGDSAFSVCTALSSITIPSGVTNIGSSAFHYCTSLSVVRFMGDAPNVEEWAFDSCWSAVAYACPGSIGWDDFTAKTGIPVVMLDKHDWEQAQRRKCFLLVHPRPRLRSGPETGGWNRSDMRRAEEDKGRQP